MRLVRLPAGPLTVLFAALTLGPLLLLTYLAIARSTNAVEAEAKARLSSTAVVSADFVKSELVSLGEIVESYAKRPLLARGLQTTSLPARRRGLRQHLRQHLRQLQAQRPGIAIAFLVDPAGQLVDIVPETPSIVGKDFAFRDWYRGVTSTGETYVSEAYTTAATGRRRVVAAATLVRAGRPKRTLGILVAGYSLAYVQQFTEQFAREQGVTLTVTDQAGAVVAAPGIPRHTLTSEAEDSAVVAALAGKTGTVDDNGDGKLLAYAPVTGLGWTVRASVPDSVAFARVAGVRNSVLATAASLALALMAGIALLGLTLRRREEAELRERAALTVTEGRTTEFDFQNPDRVLQLNSGPVRGADGVLTGRIFAVRDVTRERTAERAKSELVATVSHELRTPLTGILGFAELLAEHEVDRETRQEYVQTIADEALRLKVLIDDFLDLHRLEEGNFTLSLEPVALDDVVCEQARFYRAQSNLHTIDVDVEPGVTVLGERDRIAQVLANLLTNAIKYSPEGGQVRVSAKRSGSCARVEVHDAGIGIPADQQRHVFEKFFRVDSTDTRRIGGTGLGLALCRDIVEAHGGRIELESVEGEGSSFRFELPLAEGVHQATGLRERVLVVEDDPAMAELLRIYLEEDGYEVEVVATGEEALARADQRPPAMVCLDIGLPGRLDGWGVLAQLKSSSRTAQIPVVICTGLQSTSRALALGAAGYLSKPIARESLLDEVRELVHGRRGSVLVVDDDEQVRNFFTETLTREGLDVRVAASGAEGLDMARERRPDLLMLDLLMPGMDGLSVLEQLGTENGLSDIPVVVLTAQDLDPDERDRLRERTASLLEKKAYSAHELRQVVEQVLAA
ncbi:MAG: response regulator [Actinobacteria bacterium]|nr:response regulator [Actinomycetota bacterium]